MSDQYFDDHLDRVCVAVWETWTNNGLGLDEEDCKERMKSVRDAAANAYVEGLNDTEWCKEALARLGSR